MILSGIDEKQLEVFADKIVNAKRIFVCGAGRSLLMIKAIAMRLMHIGMQVYVVGDINTPAIKNDDLLVVASGSGETSVLMCFVNKAKKLNVPVAHITTNELSTIAKLSDIVLKIPASVNHLGCNGNSWQPAGNSFEQCLLLVGDALILIIADKLDVDISGRLSFHANLE